MSRGSSNRATNASSSANREGYFFTSGDMSRLLHVDLKTIHNWVNQGHMTGRRTKGRHLRFARIEVVEFMRAYGYPVPAVVGAAQPRVVVDAPRGGKGGAGNALRRVAEVATCGSLYCCALEVASGDQEALILDLDRRSKAEIAEFVAALAARPETAALALIGLSRSPALRRAFVKHGGNVALSATQAAELKNIVRWLTGSTETLTARAERRGA